MQEVIVRHLRTEKNIQHQPVASRHHLVNIFGMSLVVHRSVNAAAVPRIGAEGRPAMGCVFGQAV